MSVIHVLRYRNKTEWAPVSEHTDGDVITHCCHCRMPAKEARFRKHYDDWNSHQEVWCNEDAGCNVNARRRIGMWNRPAPVYGD